MGAWLLIIVIAATLIAWRLVSVAGMLWRERAHVTARCVQMETAASSGAILCERLPDGTTLLVMPGPANQDPPSSGEAISNVRQLKPL
jgi:hypothetical protein